MISCAPSDLINDARCFSCLGPRTLAEIRTYLLCQWASVGLGPADAVLNSVGAWSPGSVPLAWTSTTDPGTFEIWRSENGGAYSLVDTIAGALRTYTDVTAGMANGDTWSYKVRGVTSGVNGFFSNIISVLNSGFVWTLGALPTTENTPDIAFGNGLFVATLFTPGNLDGWDTSADGTNWSHYTAPELVPGDYFQCVAYGGGIWVKLSTLGRIFSSPDAVNWTEQVSPEGNHWEDIVYGNGLFVAVAKNGTHRVMTSPDGINWTGQIAAAAQSWYGVTYGNGIFVAVSGDGDTHSAMTSPDGVNWTLQNTPSDNVQTWGSVAFGNGIFVAISFNNDVNGVMISSDGVNWALHASATQNFWEVLCFGNGMFAAVADGETGHDVMTSFDGITWNAIATDPTHAWFGIAYGNGKFVGGHDDLTSATIISG